MNKFQDFSKDILKKMKIKLKFLLIILENILKMQVRQRESYKLEKN